MKLPITALRIERVRRGLSLKDVAEQIGTTAQAIHAIETLRRRPSYDTTVKLEDLFNKSHRELFVVEVIPVEHEAINFTSS